MVSSTRTAIRDHRATAARGAQQTSGGTLIAGQD